MTSDELENKLKSGEISALYLLHGEETFLIESALKRIKKNFGELLPGINYILLDETNVGNLISDIETPAFGYEKKLIVVKNSNLLKKEARNKKGEIQVKKNDGHTKALQDSVAEYIENNYEVFRDNTSIVFIESDVASNGLYKAIEKCGVICNFEKQKLPQVKNKIKVVCKGYKVNIDEGTLNYFIESCGLDLQNLINEIRKLIEFAGENGTITKESIDLLSIKQMDSIIFDLTDSLGKKNIAGAMNVLKNLINAKEPVQKILITLYNHFKKLYIVKLSQKYNRDVTSNLNLKANQTFLIGKYKTQANYFDTKVLRTILMEMIKLDENYKKGLIDLNIGLESILATYCS